jgi:small subunit ribosomal protein S15
VKLSKYCDRKIKIITITNGSDYIMALLKEVKEKLASDFGISKNDTGSVEVQIALLTENIRELTDHCQKHPKDFSTRRGLLKMVCRRRRFLNYLELHRVGKYKDMVQRLGLRK